MLVLEGVVKLYQEDETGNEFLIQQERTGITGSAQINAFRLGIGSGSQVAPGYVSLSMRRASTNVWSEIVQFLDIQTNGRGPQWRFAHETRFAMQAGLVSTGFDYLGNGGEVILFIRAFLPALSSGRFMDIGPRYSGNYSTPLRFWVDAQRGTDAASFFSWNTHGGGIEMMRLSNNGDLGINTANPSGRLHVNGLGATTGTFTAQFHNSTGSSNSLLIRDDGFIGFGTNFFVERLNVKGGIS